LVAVFDAASKIADRVQLIDSSTKANRQAFKKYFQNESVKEVVILGVGRYLDRNAVKPETAVRAGMNEECVEVLARLLLAL